VTNDKGDFMDPATGMENFLHPDLVDDLEAMGLRANAVVVMKSASDLNDQVLRQDQEILVSFAERIKNHNSEPFVLEYEVKRSLAYLLLGHEPLLRDPAFSDEQRSATIDRDSQVELHHVEKVEVRRIDARTVFMEATIVFSCQMRVNQSADSSHSAKMTDALPKEDWGIPRKFRYTFVADIETMIEPEHGTAENFSIRSVAPKSIPYVGP